jgi:hypothetical protein
LITGRLIALIDRKKKKGRWGGDRERRELRGGAARGVGGSGRKKKGGKGRLTGWAATSVAQGKRKRRGEEVGRRGRRDGPLGPKGSRCRFLFFYFLFFKLHFQTKFISSSNQTFQTFSQEFYKLFTNHTSNQKPCKPTDDAHTLVVSKLFKLYLIFLELNLNINLNSLNP